MQTSGKIFLALLFIFLLASSIGAVYYNYSNSSTSTSTSTSTTNTDTSTTGTSTSGTANSTNTANAASAANTSNNITNSSTVVNIPVSGPFTSTQTLICTFSVVGNIVELDWPDTFAVCSKPGPIESADGAVPAQFRPKNQVRHVCKGSSNSKDVDIIALITTSGKLRFWNNVSGQYANFEAAGNGGIAGSFLTYTKAASS